LWDYTDWSVGFELYVVRRVTFFPRFFYPSIEVKVRVTYYYALQSRTTLNIG